MSVDVEAIFTELASRLSLRVRTESVYTGGLDGPLYRDQTTIQLVLDENIISEVSIP